jgi:hypothetical protein
LFERRYHQSDVVVYPGVHPTPVLPSLACIIVGYNGGVLLYSG